VALVGPHGVRVEQRHPVSIRPEYMNAPWIFGANLHFGWQPPDPAMVAEAVAAAHNADVAIVFANGSTGRAAGARRSPCPTTRAGCLRS
jgi:hypothetical protein